ncbi:MAG TPA: leucine-rich repeat domain-containing protein [Phycisphaerales bacterium]|nr:leucine-rich repeat domain-containing protein [Phycisphaerales bacterium]
MRVNMSIPSDQVDSLIAKAKETQTLDLREFAVEMLPKWALDLHDLKELTIRLSDSAVGLDLRCFNKLRELYVRDIRNTSVADFRFPDGLTTLVLEGNPLTSVATLHLPDGLTTLCLDDNQLTSMADFRFPDGLTTLILDSNQLTSVADLHLPDGLTTLYLRHNQLTSVEGLRLPDGLEMLDLRHNQITSVVGLRLPDGLTTLMLDGNQLTSLPDLRLQDALTRLYLGGNQLTSVAHLRLPDGLTTLDLRQNQLTSVAGLCLPDGLTALDLRQNQLTSVAGLRLPDGLAWLILRSNRLTSLAGLDHLRHLGLLDLYDNPELRIPVEVWNNVTNPTRILAWFFAADTLLPEVKIAMLGQGSAGKTELRALLCSDAKANSKERTPSVEWSALSLPRVTPLVAGVSTDPHNVRCHVFDFGGQPHLHAAHRFFLSNRRSVYMIVLDAQCTLADTRLKYWLGFIEHAHEQWLRHEAEANADQLAPNHVLTEFEHLRLVDEELERARQKHSKPPVLIVITHTAPFDNSPRAVADTGGPGRKEMRRRLSTNEVRTLAGQNASVVDGFDAFDETGVMKLDEVRDALRECVAGMSEVWQTLYPKAFGTIVEKFRQTFGFDSETDDHTSPGAPMLDEEEAVRIIADACPAGSSGATIQPRDYLGVLRDLGIVHWLGDRADVDESDPVKRIVFNPRWVRGPVYDVLWTDHKGSSPEVRESVLLRTLEGREGRLEYLRRSAPRPPISADEARLVLRLMERCDLVVRLEGVSQGAWYIVPDLLPEYPPGGTPSAPAAEWSLGVVDDVLVPKLIGRLWSKRDGVVCRDSFGLKLADGTSARLAAHVQEGRLALYAEAPTAKAVQAAVDMIDDILLWILKRSVRGTVTGRVRSVEAVHDWDNENLEKSNARPERQRPQSRRPSGSPKSPSLVELKRRDDQTTPALFEYLSERFHLRGQRIREIRTHFERDVRTSRARCCRLSEGRLRVYYRTGCLLHYLSVSNASEPPKSSDFPDLYDAEPSLAGTIWCALVIHEREYLKIQRSRSGRGVNGESKSPRKNPTREDLIPDREAFLKGYRDAINAVERGTAG